jgi:hypothetical protein
MTDLTRARVLRTQIATLSDFTEGEWVEYDEGQYGVITGVVDGPLEWPGEDEPIPDQGDGKQIAIVARASGGSKPFTFDEIAQVERDTVIDTDAVPDDPEEEIDEAEMATFYYRMDDPSCYEELISVPGVDDPGVGFDSWPDSWVKADEPARLIALDAWSSMGGTWTGCFAEIGSRRLCAAFKDEILGTEEWRGKF